ncbi:hypothetical protein FB446DRAFT_625208, partial [Lentinula raphanica]
SFIKCILAYNAECSVTGQGGIFGHVSAYYGCVEAQGRGTLHCHMLVWLHGALNPDQIKARISGVDGAAFKERLIQFLEDTISSSTPSDPDPDFRVQSCSFHPCSVRGISHSYPNVLKEKALAKDRYNLIKSCQTHKHSPTCYKYWKGPPEPRECRFDLDQTNVNAESYFDTETGDLHLRKLDGLINNFNLTISEALRCNTDVKFVASGPCAKAVMYYVTDYITKSQLKAHVAYAALESALQRLGPFDEGEDDVSIRGKRLLQRCSYALMNQQELSAQQVASYVLDFGDHYTSHSYAKLFWLSFENHINTQSPSPECYVTHKPLSANGDPTDTIPTTTSCTSDEEVAMAPDFLVANDTDVALSISSSQEMRKLGSQVEDYIFR